MVKGSWVVHIDVLNSPHAESLYILKTLGKRNWRFAWTCAHSFKTN